MDSTDRMLPMPVQRGQTRWLDSPSDGRRRWRGHLQQAEARQASDLDARAIHLHRVAQPVFHVALVLRRLHVDEVDDDEAADVADTELTGDFVRGFEVGVGRRGLDVRRRAWRARS
jgi:hypothetical protein